MTPQNPVSSVHICLISQQPMANLIPLLHEKPTTAIFLVSPEMTEVARRIRDVLRRHGIKVEMYSVASAFKYDLILKACEQLTKEHTQASLTLNVTGGTKIAALAAFQACYFADHSNIRIIYCDTEHDHLLQLTPESTTDMLKPNLVPIRDYLACYGLQTNSDGSPPPDSEARRSHLHDLATLLVRNEGLLSKLNSACSNLPSHASFANIDINRLGSGAEQLSPLLEKCQVARHTGSNNLNINNQDSIFFCNGGWLEEYAFWTVQGLSVKGMKPAMNVTVTWDTPGKKTTKNEFDVLFTHRNRLHLISCKAANPERETSSGTRATEALNELDTLIDRAGGIFGKPMLLSARRLSDFDRIRAKEMKILLVDGQEVLNLAQHLRSWLKLG